MAARTHAAQQLPAIAQTPGGEHTPLPALIIAIAGVLLALAWVLWRFGPTLVRVFGLAWTWAGWMCAIAGGWTYAIGLIALGAITWGFGTAWYARRRGHWPSAISAHLFARLLGSRNPTDAYLIAGTRWRTGGRS
jgi:hypothetical protein